MRSLAVVALAASAAGACVENEDIASYASAGTQYCAMSTWCKDVSCTGNAGTWARLGYATCKADSSDNLCGATTSNCGDYGINKATMDCDCVPGDDDGAVMPAGCDTSSSSSSTSTSTSSSSRAEDFIASSSSFSSSTLSAPSARDNPLDGVHRTLRDFNRNISRSTTRAGRRASRTRAEI